VPPRRRRRRWLGQWQPLLLGEETCSFPPHDCITLLSNIIPGFQPVTKHFKNYFRVWTLSGLRVWIVWANKLGKDV
jgi:hypothetical protein